MNTQGITRYDFDHEGMFYHEEGDFVMYDDLVAVVEALNERILLLQETLEQLSNL